MIMFRTGTFMWKHELINKVEVTKTTEKSVWFQNPNNYEMRELRHTSYFDWWETEEEAIEHLLKKAERMLNRGNSMVSTAGNRIIRLNDMKKGLKNA